MYIVYIAGKEVAHFKEDEADKAHALAKKLRETNDEVWVELN